MTEASTRARCCGCFTDWGEFCIVALVYCLKKKQNVITPPRDLLGFGYYSGFYRSEYETDATAVENLITNGENNIEFNYKAAMNIPIDLQ
jgi:hypothetical protein